jgi:hypothetical protein
MEMADGIYLDIKKNQGLFIFWKWNRRKFSQIAISHQIKTVPSDKVSILQSGTVSVALLKTSISDMQTISLSTVQFSSKDALDYSEKRTE